LHEYWKTEQYKKRHKSHKYKEYKKRYEKERRIKDYCYRLYYGVSNGIYNSLKKNKKGRKWESLVGYTLNDLMIHLEKQFKPWMSWENWGKGKGKWNIDHIKPKSLFHYTSPEDQEFKECWALSNLRPLEAHENLVKHNKYGI
jgi:hypothetical protein